LVTVTPTGGDFLIHIAGKLARIKLICLAIRSIKWLEQQEKHPRLITNQLLYQLS
jgi:hypothetical protein